MNTINPSTSIKNPHNKNNQAIGVFDSGLGGISVLKALLETLPNEHFIYVGDSAHVPYGGKSNHEIFLRMRAITQFLINKACKAIVVACNTATAAAIDQLRQAYPMVPIIAIEPAIKPAVQQTKTKKIAVLATYHTIHSERVARLVASYAQDCQVVLQACPGLADAIEHFPDSLALTVELVEKYCHPLCNQDIDVVVLGCTHYPLVHEQITMVLGSQIQLIEPGYAVAKQLASQLKQNNLLTDANISTYALNRVEAYSTANAPRLTAALTHWLRTLLPVPLIASQVSII